MNTKHLKAYAPQARRQFMDAVSKRAAHFGIYQNEIAPVTFTGSVAMIEGKAFTKQQGEQRKRLEKQVTEKGFDLFIREMAYTWFNRLAALRYMEIHGYLEHGFRVLSHPKSKDALPEILDHAADVANLLGLNKAQIVELQLAGDKQEVLYRELLLGQCHHLHSIMPFLFEAIDDATELLLPDNLTKTDSILKGLISDIPEEDWQQIEVIGWLYQFYISEYKDTVMGKVVKSEDIPAATQLFTPNWIVKYLVQNSVGRQWLATYPDSTLKSKMEYYIEPAEQTDEVLAQLKAITPGSIDPESIKALDPAAGSGHILVEVYELLKEIYLERGYLLREIPTHILTKNIYGLDIDDRAAQLAGFALMMKAREDDKRIFKRVQDGDVKLNVHALQSTADWDSAAIWQALNLDGKAKQGSSGDMFAEDSGFKQPTGEFAGYFELLKYLIVSFEQAKTLGSLIQIDHQYLSALRQFKAKLVEKIKHTDPASIAAAEMLQPVVEQAIVLAQKYDAVIANPPYMGSKGMNDTLKDFAKVSFPRSKSDLFSMFMERAFSFTHKWGFNAQVNMQSWMFLSTHEKLREHILSEKSISTMAHLGSKAFSQISGEVVKTTAWVIRNEKIIGIKPTFFRLTKFGEEDKRLNLVNKQCVFDKMSVEEFSNIPGKPLAYWLSDCFINSFKGENVARHSISNGQNKTANNDKFLRYHWEIDNSDVGIGRKWLLYAKGGGFRKWAGNLENVIDWSESARQHYRKDSSCRIIPEELWYEKGITWSRVGSDATPPSFRFLPTEATFDMVGSSIFIKDNDNLLFILSVLNSSISQRVFDVLNPSVDIQVKDVLNFPLPEKLDREKIVNNAKKILEEMETDWNNQEVSFNFTTPHIFKKKFKLISTTVEKIIEEGEKTIEKLKQIEEDNNREIIKSMKLDDEIPEEVDLKHITHNLNVFYISEGMERSNAIIISNLVTDCISFFIGCFFGRYALNQSGVIFAHRDNNLLKNIIASGAYGSFEIDNDGIIPLASEEWLFEDDATARFREFVKTVWGIEHLQDNLEFIAKSLCLHALKAKKDESAMETIRRYLSTQFFVDHCKTYKKRPIYWLFSSGKEKAFECLVYLHRYNEATLSRMRTEYVTPLMGKYNHQLARKIEEVTEASGTEQRRLEAEIKDIEKKQLELRKFDEDLKHFADMRITLDLDDGVKENYGKFGNLLANVKDIHGKAVK